MLPLTFQIQQALLRHHLILRINFEKLIHGQGKHKGEQVLLFNAFDFLFIYYALSYLVCKHLIVVGRGNTLDKTVHYNLNTV